MQALTDVSEHKADNSRSTTPVAMEDKAGEVEEKRKAKKRFSSEGWSQESDVEEEIEKKCVVRSILFKNTSFLI